MSLFGKLLALLNLLGAVGLIYLASVDYSARQQWAYVVFRYDLMLDGVPVDDSQVDKQGQPTIDHISDETINELFSQVGGKPVRTQVEEVKAIQDSLNSQIQALETNKRQQAFYLAGVLLPLSDSLLERDEYLATQAHLSNDESVKALESRYSAALRDAKKEGASGPDRSFAQAFRLGVRSQGGAPSEAITTLIVDRLPADPQANVNIAVLFSEALDTQRLKMLKRLEWLFADALTNADQSMSAAADRPKNSRESQRAAIARLLFGLSGARALMDITADSSHPDVARLKGFSPGTADWSRALASCESVRRYQRRVFVLSGIKTALNAIAARSATVRILASQVDAASADERILFLSDDAALLSQAREQAERLRVETTQIAENLKKLADQRVSLKQRQKDVEEAEAALKESTDETAQTIAKLREQTDKARLVRIKARDLLGTLADKEREIRDLERQVRDAESKAGGGSKP